jgi:hypothetical protein
MSEKVKGKPCFACHQSKINEIGWWRGLGAHCPWGREVPHVISLLLVRFSTLYVEKQ